MHRDKGDREIHVPDRSSIRAAAIHGAAWSVADKWGVRVASLATFAALSRILEPAEFGLVAAAQIVVMLLQTVSNQGIVQALVVAPNLTPSYKATASSIALVTGLMSTFAVIVCATPLSRLFNQPNFAPVVSALGCTLLLQAVGSVPTAQLQRSLQFKRLAQRSVISAILGGAAGVTAAMVGWGVWALVAQSLTQVAVATLLAWFAARMKPTLGWNRRDARAMMRFAGPVMLADIVAVVIGQGDNFVVGAALGSIALGYYTIAFRLLNTIVDAFTGVMSAVSLPIFVQLSEDAAGSKSAYLRATQVSFAIATPIFLALAAAAPTAVTLVFGSQWEQSVPLFRILCFAGIASSALYFDRTVLLAAGLVRLELFISVCLALATIVAAVIGVQFGLATAATLVTARIYLTWPLRFWALKRAIPVRAIDLAVRLRGIALAACCQAVVSIGLLVALPEGDVATLGVAAGGPIIYLTALAFTDRALLYGTLRLLVDRAPRGGGL